MPLIHDDLLFPLVEPRLTGSRYRMAALAGDILLLYLVLYIRSKGEPVRIIPVAVEAEVFLVLPDCVIIWCKECPFSRAVRITVTPVRYAISKTGDICRVCQACPVCFYIRSLIRGLSLFTERSLGDSSSGIAISSTIFIMTSETERLKG